MLAQFRKTATENKQADSGWKNRGKSRLPG
jgi:hypothetical protein